MWTKHHLYYDLMWTGLVYMLSMSLSYFTTGGGEIDSLPFSLTTPIKSRSSILCYTAKSGKMTHKRYSRGTWIHHSYEMWVQYGESVIKENLQYHSVDYKICIEVIITKCVVQKYGVGVQRNVTVQQKPCRLILTHLQWRVNFSWLTSMACRSALILMPIHANHLHKGLLVLALI